MNKLANIYRDSYRELKNVRTITTAAMFLAISVVLGYFTIEAGPYLKIGFGTVANQFVYYLFGPVVGGLYGGVLDLVKYIVKPTGGFFPGFTFNAILAGIIYGTLLYHRPLTFKRVLGVHFIVIMVCNVCLNTLWLSMLSGKAIMVLIPMRLVKNLIMWPVDTAIFYLIAKEMEHIGVVKAIKNIQISKAKIQK
ncbi:MAG: folate family ECF transporter S component [Clostridium sp.]